MALPVRNRTNAWWVRATRATITPREDIFCELENFSNPQFLLLSQRLNNFIGGNTGIIISNHSVIKILLHIFEMLLSIL